MNLYAYVHNDPVNGKDVSGMVWGKVARFGGKVLRYRGNVVKAGKETAVEIGNAAKTLGDGKLDGSDAFALFDLVSPVSAKEVKAGVRGARRAISGNKTAKGPETTMSMAGKRSRYGGEAYEAGHGRKVTGELGKGAPLSGVGNGVANSFNSLAEGDFAASRQEFLDGAIIGAGAGGLGAAALGIAGSSIATGVAVAATLGVFNAHGDKAVETRENLRKE